MSFTEELEPLGLTLEQKALLLNPFGEKDKNALINFVNQLPGGDLKAIGQKFIGALEAKNWEINLRPPFNEDSPLVGVL